MPLRRIAAAPSAASPETLRRSRRSSASASSESCARSTASSTRSCAVASVSVSSERARMTSTSVSKTTKTACSSTMPSDRCPSAHDPHPGARVLQQREAEMMDRHERGGGDDGAPVAVDQQERQRAEDVEVHLDHAVRLADEERGVGHQAERDEDPRPERARRPLRQHVGARRHAAADDERGEPGAVERRRGRARRGSAGREGGSAVGPPLGGPRAAAPEARERRSYALSSTSTATTLRPRVR